MFSSAMEGSYNEKVSVPEKKNCKSKTKMELVRGKELPFVRRSRPLERERERVVRSAV